MSVDVILGSGMAGCGAAHAFTAAGRKPLMFDRNGYPGGHTATFAHEGGWLFDDGPHISFTKNERMQDVLAQSVDQEYETIQARVNNYWQGHWIKHPAPANLHGLPDDLVARILSEFAEAGRGDDLPPANYADWLVKAYGRTFAETFPMSYGLKYHTTEAANMTTEWLGDRLYRPSLEEAIKGALSPATPDVHYINHFRYPTHGGFFSYLRSFLELAEVHLNHEVTAIDPQARVVRFGNGESVEYRSLVSSIPLPALVPMIASCPSEVVEAASRLAWTQGVIVNLGVDRDDVSPAHWSYFYDQDFLITRISCPHMLSPNTVPRGSGSIQAEIYFSEKYRPLTVAPDELIPRVVDDLKRCGLFRANEKILFSGAYLTPWAQVIFDLERGPALEIVRGYLDEVGIQTCGRYGEWGYQWTDEAFESGERAAQRTLGKNGPQ